MPAAVVDQVLAGDLEVVRAAVKDMPEVDRRRLARSAIRLLRDAEPSPEVVTELRRALGDRSNLVVAAAVALAADRRPTSTVTRRPSWPKPTSNITEARSGRTRVREPASANAPKCSCSPR